MTEAQAEFGPVDVLVCCAGLAHPHFFTDTTHALFKSEMELNYMGYVNAASAVVGEMIKQRRGQILFVSSGLGLMGFYYF